jgi:hypothetical protein
MENAVASPHTQRYQIGDVYLGITHELFRVVGEATYDDFRQRYPTMMDWYPFYYWVVPA